MKNKIFGLGVLGAIAIPAVGLVSCGSTVEYSVKSINDNALKFKGDKNTTKTIGALVADPENPRWKKAKGFADKYGNAMFKSAITNILKTDADQKNWFNSNSSKIDALVVGAKTDTFSPWTSTWADSSKPVVAFDRLIKGDRKAYNWYVTYDNSGVGRMQGISILNKLYSQNWTNKTADNVIENHVKTNKLSDKKIVISVAGDTGDNNSKLFFNGAMNLFKKVAAIDTNFVVPGANNSYNTTDFTDFSKVAQIDWDYAKGQTFLQGEITKMTSANRKNIAAVLSPNDGMATSAINALKQNALDPKEVFITGQDSNDSAILSIGGKKLPGQDMTISKPDRDSMAVAMSLAKHLIEDPAYNVSVSGLVKKDANATDLIKLIKEDFDGIEVKYDGISYETAAGTKINTLILTPKIITSADIGSGKTFEIIN